MLNQQQEETQRLLPRPSPKKSTPPRKAEKRVFVEHQGIGRKIVTEKGSANVGQNIPKSFVLKPALVSPNSYDSVRSVLIHVGREAGIQKYGTGDKQFLFLYCDGLPYSLIQRMCRCTFRCSVCSEILTDRPKCEKHQHANCTFSKEFDWVLLVPGGGHIQMNMLKAIVDILWPVCWKEMVGLFNFRSEIALQSARKVSDHHKGWTMLRIFRNAVCDELLVPFVRKELQVLCVQ